MKFRSPCGAPLVLAAALMLPAAAQASGADVVGDTLSVQGGALQRNEIAVTLTRNESNGELFYLIAELRDGGPRVLAGDQCTTGSSIPTQAVSDSFFSQIGQRIASNPLISELGNQLLNRAKTVGCISSGSGSFLELGGAQNINKIVIDLKDSADSATVDALFPIGTSSPPSVGVAPVEMHGGAQDDKLTGGPNADVLLGEKGDDIIQSRGGVPDQVLCGRGPTPRGSTCETWSCRTARRSSASRWTRRPARRSSARACRATARCARCWRAPPTTVAAARSRCAARRGACGTPSATGWRPAPSVR
jgi:hypothetical protein